MKTLIKTGIKANIQIMGLALLASTANAETDAHAMMSNDNHMNHKNMNHSQMTHSQMNHDTHKMSEHQGHHATHTNHHEAMNHSKMHHDMNHHSDKNHETHANHPNNQHAIEKLTPKTSLAKLKAQGFYAGNHHGMEHSDHDDDPLLSKVLIDQLEMRRTKGETTTVLEAEAWTGYDLNKLWFVVDAERHESELEELKLSLHYGRAVSAYWDVIAGVRQEIKPHKVTWGVLGVKGLAPYFLETDATLAVNKDGVIHANITAEHEAMLTQKWVLSPEFSVNAYSKATEESGKGISDASLGLRLRYEVNRQFAPYVGVVSSWKLGDTADMARDDEHETQVTQAVFGLQAWF